MKKDLLHKQEKSVIFLLFISLFSISCVNKKIYKSYPKADNGVLDLRNWDFEKDGNVPLTGKWQLYWKNFYSLEEINGNKAINETTISYPGTWRNRKVAGEAISGFGYATYHLKILINNNHKDIALAFHNQSNPYTLFIDGKKIDSNGTIGNTRESTKGGFTSKIIPFNIKDSTVEVVLHVSNYVYFNGGMRELIYIGTHENLHNKREYGLIIGLFLLGCISIMGVYNLFLYLFKMDEKSYLYLTLICFSGCMSPIITTENLIDKVLFYIPWDMLHRFWSLAPCLLGIFVIKYFAYIFPKEVKCFIVNTIYLFYTVSIPIIILLPLYIAVNYCDSIVIPFTGLAGIYIQYIVTMAFIRKREGSVLTFLGASLWMLAGINDMLHIMFVINTGFYNEYGLSFFIFTLIVTSAKRSSHAYTHLEISRKEVTFLNEELKQKDQSRTVFFQNTSHELRTPLNGIIGFTQLLINDSYNASPDIIRSKLVKIVNLANSLKNQVNAILDIAKSSSGNIELNINQFVLEEITDEAQFLAEGLVAQYPNAKFSIDKSWLKGTPVYFINDKEKISAIVRNLLGNAFKFSIPSKTNEIKFKILLDNKGDLVLEISDQGIGIPDDQIDTVFEEFKQVEDQSNRRFEGTGLGLSIVKRFIDLMKGSIELKSETGSGTTFIIKIPNKNQKEDLIALKSNKPITKSIDLNLAYSKDLKVPKNEVEKKKNEKYTILIIDDNEINCEVVSEILESQQYNTEISLSGEDGLEKIKNNPPDLVLLDLMMPKFSGEDFLKTIKNDSSLRDIPIILLTARASHSDKILGFKLGADDYLAKPIEVEELILRVKNVLTRVDLVKSVEQVIHREKMAQVGDLMADVVHEIKNVNIYGRTKLDRERKMMVAVLNESCINTPIWKDVVDALSKPNIDINSMNYRKQEVLLVPPPLKTLAVPLSLISIIISKINIDEEKVKKLWDLIINSSNAKIGHIQKLLSLFNVINIMDIKAKKTHELITSILDCTRESNVDTAFDMNQIVANAFSILQTKFSSHKIDFKINIDKDKNVLGNKSEIYQIVLNLINNALDAIVSQKVEHGTMTIYSSRINDIVTFSFKDNGGGIPEENLKKIFERNFSTKGDKGSGIGLFVSKKLAQKNKGFLDVISKDRTTTFQLKLRSDSKATDQN